MEVLFAVDGGEEKVIVVSNDKDVKIGRAKKNDIVLTKAGVSWHHVLLRLKGSNGNSAPQLQLVDTSSNGTTIETPGGERIAVAKDQTCLVDLGSYLYIPTHVQGDDPGQRTRVRVDRPGAGGAAAAPAAKSARRSAASSVGESAENASASQASRRLSGGAAVPPTLAAIPRTPDRDEEEAAPPADGHGCTNDSEAVPPPERRKLPRPVAKAPSVAEEKRDRSRSREREPSHDSNRAYAAGHTGDAPEVLPPAYPGPSKAGNFMVVLERTTGDEKLGIGITFPEMKMCVGQLYESGLVVDWNRQHPQAAVRAQDQIYSVNGVNNNTKVMCDALSTARELRILMHRSPQEPGAEAESPQEHGLPPMFGASQCAGMPAHVPPPLPVAPKRSLPVPAVNRPAIPAQLPWRPEALAFQGKYQGCPPMPPPHVGGCPRMGAPYGAPIGAPMGASGYSGYCAQRSNMLPGAPPPAAPTSKMSPQAPPARYR
mmetsp:Transcript_67362/g.161516  ORF Transcript_67362/g.161516 Transcript_67362/m.161516 type:complete len:485 (-) Transcript_67362:13-1467(-)